VLKFYTEKQMRNRIQTAVDAAVASAVAPLLARLAELEQQIARLKKNSSNSSKPPSSDIVKPTQITVCRKKGKRRKGAQPGHPRHERTPFTEEEIDRQVTYEREDLDPQEWEPLDEWDVVQQIELKESPVEIIEHRARHYRHRRTDQVVCAALPEEVKAAGLVGPRLSAYVAFLKGACHMSYTTIQTLLADVFGVTLSTGQLAKITTGKVSAALAAAYAELRAALPTQDRLGIDETGHKDEGRKLWSWCFRAHDFTLFHIAASRGSDVLIALLGAAFDGVIHCDYFSAYRKFMKDSSAVMQFCLAHLIRDVKFLAESTDKVTHNWADKTLNDFRALFRLIHRRDSVPEASFTRQLAASRDRLIQRFLRSPDRAGVRDLRQRFRLHPQEFFTFVTTPGVEPTNNMTEQAIRYLIIDRRITQGTRGQKGQRWCERIWTTISTCEAQGRSVFKFLCAAILAHFKRDPAPSLMPSGP
jgi:transposase